MSETVASNSPGIAPALAIAAVGASQDPALSKLLEAMLQEQRSARRWRTFFLLLKSVWWFGVLAVFLLFAGAFSTFSTSYDRNSDNAPIERRGPHTAVVDFTGAILAGADNDASAENLITGLRRAFRARDVKGVILRIDSPGGSPVQAGLVNDEIRRLRKENPSIPIYTVVEDLCASGAYYVAVATDKIFVNRASLVGSIGVLMDGFGFTGAMEKLGVERRLMTAGKNKAFLDPFSPRKPEHVRFINTLLGELHEQFIQVVRDGRGKRLKETEETFSGLVWSGERGVEMGLVDALGNVDSVARDEIKAEPIIDYTVHQNWSTRLARSLGGSMGQTLFTQSFAHGLTGALPAAHVAGAAPAVATPMFYSPLFAPHTGVQTTP